MKNYSLSESFWYILLALIYILFFISFCGLIQLIFTGKANMGSISDLLTVALNSVLAGCAFAAYRNWKKDKIVDDVKAVITDAYIIYHSSRQFYNTLYCYHVDPSSTEAEGKGLSYEDFRETLNKQYQELDNAYHNLSKNIDILCFFYKNNENNLFEIRSQSAYIRCKVKEELDSFPVRDSKTISIFEKIKQKNKKESILDLIIEENIFPLPNQVGTPDESFSLSCFKTNFTKATKSILKI